MFKLQWYGGLWSECNIWEHRIGRCQVRVSAGGTGAKGLASFSLEDSTFTGARDTMQTLGHFFSDMFRNSRVFLH